LFYSFLPSPSLASSTAAAAASETEEENLDYSSCEAMIDIFSHYLRLLSKDNQLTLQSMNCLLSLKGETHSNNNEKNNNKDEKNIEIIKQSIEIFLSFHEEISRTIQRRSSKLAMTVAAEPTADKKKKKDSFVFSFFRSNSDRFRKEREAAKSTEAEEEEKDDIIEIVNQLNKFVLSSSETVEGDAGKADGSGSGSENTSKLSRQKSSREEVIFIHQFYSFFEEILFVFQYSSLFKIDSSQEMKNFMTKSTLRDLMNNNNEKFDDNNSISLYGMNSFSNHSVLVPKKASLFFSSFHCNYLLYLQNSLSFKYEQPMPCIRIKVISNADNQFQQKVLLEKDTQLFTATVASEEIKTNKTVSFPDVIELDLLEIFGQEASPLLSSSPHLYQFLSIRIELRYYRSNYESICVGFIQLPFLLSFTAFNKGNDQWEEKKPQQQQHYHIFHFNENDNMVKAAVDHAVNEQRPLTHLSFSLSSEFSF
jgi:hypothetical protein